MYVCDGDGGDTGMWFQALSVFAENAAQVAFTSRLVTESPVPSGLDSAMSKRALSRDEPCRTTMLRSKRRGGEMRSSSPPYPGQYLVLSPQSRMAQPHLVGFPSAARKHLLANSMLAGPVPESMRQKCGETATHTFDLGPFLRARHLGQPMPSHRAVLLC
ncbi:hypothetical protein LY78DRAFT_391940 [Colletotrichum sublineola]|nr:hypothetical protein LY78DRAFT_391940 [Colletotrichum sublineola]